MAYKVFQNGFPLNASELNNYLMNQSVMVFASTTARDADLTAPTEGMIVWLQDANKFVYHTGTAWADVDSTYESGNAIINGAFDIWQRGASFNMNTTPYYGADRWQAYRASAVVGGTISRQAASLNGFTYAARVQRDSGNTSANDMNLASSFETQFISTFWGQTLTLSFYARAGANYSATNNILRGAIWSGVGTDGSMGSGFTTPTEVTGVDFTLTTSWQRFTLTTTVLPNTATQLAARIKYTPVGTAGANDYFEITGVQLEAGSVATPFKRNAPSTQAELAACQRYYFRRSSTSPNSTYTPLASGVTQSATVHWMTVQYPVPMRTAPSSIEYANLSLAIPGLTGYTPSSVSLINAAEQMTLLQVVTASSVYTTGQAPALNVNNTNAGYLGFSAEL